MTIDAAAVADARPDFGGWSATEVLDTQLAEGLLLRATVCPLAAGNWEWNVSSLDGDRCELISAGVATDPAAARLMATLELSKCVESGLD